MAAVILNRNSAMRQGVPVTYFSRFSRFGNPINARETVENQLFYRSASRFDVFSCFSSHMSQKPAFLRESSDRIAARFGANRTIDIKELGAGHGESMAFLLGDLSSRHPEVFAKTAACASDGYLPIVESMRNSPLLKRFIDGGTLSAAHEDLMGELPCRQKADYIRISYTLTDLPEDMIKKENGEFFVAFVRGYVKGLEPFVTDTGAKVPAEKIAQLLLKRDIDEILGLGLDIRDIQPRVGYDVEYRPMTPSRVNGGSLAISILKEICKDTDSTNLRSGFNAARAVEKMIGNHLKADAGSVIEIFDIWTSSILEGMPVPLTELIMTSVNSTSFPFLKEYLISKDMDVSVGFEDWKEYVRLSEPYIYLSHFSKWQGKGGEETSKLLGRAISSDSAERIRNFLEDTKHVADMVLYSEKDTHPVIKQLRKEGLTGPEIDILFKSGQFPEPDKSTSRGFRGLYQVATIERK